MSVILLAFIEAIAGLYGWYFIGLYIYSILCLFSAKEIFKEPSIVSRVQTVLSVFYEPFMAIIRKKLHWKVDLSGFVLILIIHFIDNILMMSGFLAVIKTWARS